MSNTTVNTGYIKLENCFAEYHREPIPVFKGIYGDLYVKHSNRFRLIQVDESGATFFETKDMTAYIPVTGLPEDSTISSRYYAKPRRVNTEERELFTPGTWSYQKSSDNQRWEIVGDMFVLVLHTIDGDLAKAKAQLIAAAPDLYEALKKLKNVAAETTRNLIAWDGADILDKAIDQAIEALKKANPNYKP